MIKLLKSLWRVVTFPFVLVFNILAFPFRLIRRAHNFLNRELEEDRPLLDTFASIAAEEQARASLWDHVEALRAHLLRIVIALAVGVGISFYFTIPLMEFLAGPVNGLKNLQAIEVTEEFGVFMRVALTSGIAIMLPYIAFELWLFVAPGLRPRERKMGLAGIPLATILFLGGMAFTFFYLIPAALPFLGNFTAISQFWTAREYFKFVTGLMLWIGLFFEFPLVIYVLTSIGFVQPRVLAQQWRLAVIIIAVIAAAVTPTVDAVTMGLVMLPLTLLYFISIGLSYIAYAGRRRRREDEERSASGETEVA
ncbi:MAG: twin-arginine translocase subunit TatC [Anaerolineales bacterium]|nr:twin-arginine translocase subunit TatC [Anaerolineales bacterium]NUQ85829.1 twin-arginine translocase subunit TatC [Anaerolineales bacterium]